MPTRLLYYNPAIITQRAHNELPGMKRFFAYFSLYGFVAPVDRTGTLRIPIRTTSLHPLPEPRPFRATYEEICDTRARELLRRAREQNWRMYVLWSGGIDSTLLLVSLLKHIPSEQKPMLTVLLSENSIAEYPDFYRDHIRGKLRVEPSDIFGHLLGGDHLLIGGEHNDQLFGSDMIGALIRKFGPEAIHQKYRRETFFALFDEKIKDPVMTNFYLDLFERLKEASPAEIVENHHFLWWINFAIKWQDVSLRMLAHTAPRNAERVDARYIGTRYVHFYNTDDFQRWSIANPDKKIKETWNSYKWPCKEIIFGFTKDAAYRDNKTKRASLCNMIAQHPSHNFIREDGKLLYRLEAAEWFNPENDFI